MKKMVFVLLSYYNMNHAFCKVLFNFYGCQFVIYSSKVVSTQGSTLSPGHSVPLSTLSVKNAQTNFAADSCDEALKQFLKQENAQSGCALSRFY